MCSWVFLCPQTPASSEGSFYLTLHFILFCVSSEILFTRAMKGCNIWQSDGANHSPQPRVSAPKAFANSPPSRRVVQTSVYGPLKLFLKIISSYHNRLADSSLLFSIIINEAAIVIFSSPIIHSHYACRVKWMVFNKEEESPCTVAGLGNKVRPNTLLKHIATLREQKLAIHHARLTSMLCCPAATVGPGVCAHTHAALCFPRALIHHHVYPGCGSRLQRNGRAKWFCPCTLRRSETCLKVGEYGRPTVQKLLRLIVNPFLFRYLKSRGGKQKDLENLQPNCTSRSYTFWIFLAWRSTASHPGGGRHTFITLASNRHLFFFSLSLFCTISKLHLSAVKLFGFGSPMVLMCIF